MKNEERQWNRINEQGKAHRDDSQKSDVHLKIDDDVSIKKKTTGIWWTQWDNTKKSMRSNTIKEKERKKKEITK